MAEARGAADAMGPSGLGVPRSDDQQIDGVRLIALRPHEDARGSLTEVYRRDWLGGPGEAGEAVQANLSISRAGVLRGLHFHRRQSDYWCVLSGRAFVGLYDCRGGSPTEGLAAHAALDAGEGRHGLSIPRGVAHGFYAESDVVLLYLVDEYFTGGDEFGIAWDDPQIGIPWPVTDPVLSDRDRSNPSLAEALADAPAFRP